jgi:hypothetical protein
MQAGAGRPRAAPSSAVKLARALCLLPCFRGEPITIGLTLMALVLGCRREPPQDQRTSSVADLAASERVDHPTPVPLAIDAAPAPEAAASMEPDADAGACEPEMAMNHQPGAHDRYRFEAPDGRHGFKDQNGKVVIEPRFRFAYEFSPGGIAPVVEEKRFAFIDVNGRAIAEAYSYDNGPDYFVEGRARILKNGKVGFIDRAGKIAVEPHWEFAASFCEGRAAVCKGCRVRVRRGEKELGGGKWGYIDLDGNVVVPPELEFAEPFQGGEAIVVRGNRRERIDRSGKVLAVLDAGS